MLRLPDPARTYTVQNPIFLLGCYAICNFISILLFLASNSVMAEQLSKALISWRPQAQPTNIHICLIFNE